MKKIAIIVFFSMLSVAGYSQDSLPMMEPQWEEPQTEAQQVDSSRVLKSTISELIEIVPKWFAPEPETPKNDLTQADVQSIEADVKFMDELPASYENMPKEDLQNAIVKIDQKIAELTSQLNTLLAQRVVNQQLVQAKENTINSLQKEKEIIGLTIESDDLKDANGNLIGQNDELKIEQEHLRRYLYIAISVLGLLTLIVAIVLQRRRIQVQDVEIEEQIRDINKKNTYLDHAARLIRHDMHSGINTYMPRGISSLEKRVDADKRKELKIDGAIKMIKEGLAHTQKVYKNVYEFTNLVKENVVLEKKIINLSTELKAFFGSTSYNSQVVIDELGSLEVNPVLFCSAIDNLVRNGLKYNDSETKEVKIYRLGTEICIEDNGRGLSPEVFQQVLQHKIETVGDDGGEGLGLNITNAIFEEHGYHLSCEKLTQGTKMKISIHD